MTPPMPHRAAPDGSTARLPRLLAAVWLALAGLLAGCGTISWDAAMPNPHAACARPSPATPACAACDSACCGLAPACEVHCAQPAHVEWDGLINGYLAGMLECNRLWQGSAVQFNLLNFATDENDELIGLGVKNLFYAGVGIVGFRLHLLPYFEFGLGMAAYKPEPWIEPCAACRPCPQLACAAWQAARQERKEALQEQIRAHDAWTRATQEQINLANSQAAIKTEKLNELQQELDSRKAGPAAIPQAPPMPESPEAPGTPAPLE